MKFTRMLIVPSLWLATGYAAPAFAQNSPNVGTGYGHGFCRDYSEAGDSCVFENTGRPYSGLLGFGDVHGNCADDAGMWHHWTVGETVCWLDGWHSLPLEVFSLSMQWGPEEGNRDLCGAYVVARDGTESMGTFGASNWMTPIPGTPTWPEFVAGDPIDLTLRWSTSSEYLYFGYWEYLREQGFEQMPWETFENYYGVRPWRAQVRVRLEWIADYFTVRGGMLFGGETRLTVTVEPDPMAPDLDRNGVCDVPDVFLFLESWFASEPVGDWDCDPDCECTVADVFAFLSEWFEGE